MQRRPDPAPFEGDAVLIVTAGTVLWLLAGVALLPFWTRLGHDGHRWWLAACAWGFALGLLGRRGCLRRARRPAGTDQP
jgi:hypothetical protein